MSQSQQQQDQQGHIHGAFNVWIMVSCFLVGCIIRALSIILTTITDNSVIDLFERVSHHKQTHHLLFEKEENKEKEKEEKHLSILLIFAHPDDEAMFFSPSLHILKNIEHLLLHNNTAIGPNPRVSFHFLCLTSGNFDKLGEKRKEEMRESTEWYNVDSVDIYDDESIAADGPDSVWNLEFLAHEIIAKKIVEKNIDVVFTFDNIGVSGHKNHKDTFAAVQLALARMKRLYQEKVVEKMNHIQKNSINNTNDNNKKKEDEDEDDRNEGGAAGAAGAAVASIVAAVPPPLPPLAFKLTSLSLFQKYTSLLGVTLRGLSTSLAQRELKMKKKQKEESQSSLSSSSSSTVEKKEFEEKERENIEQDLDDQKKRSRPPSPERLTIILPPNQFVWCAMRGLWNHRSQFVWFRFFYVLFASYTYENILEQF